jgi:hypothetical protein
MTPRALLFIALCIVSIAGCAPKTLYSWNNYDEKLYQHYKDPANNDEFVEQLREVISEAEESGKVPPGLYAEYGFALFEKGSYPDASRYFKLESDKWPQSRVLMAKMIKNVEQRASVKKQGDKAASPEAVKTATAAAEGGSK